MDSQGNIEKVVSTYICESISVPEHELDHNADIFDSGFVNSLFAIELMTFIEKSFDIKIGMDDLDMNNFKSVNMISCFVHSKRRGRMDDD